MAAEQSREHADWRARQKERERERRRMRDRQRRQSMSVEEREKHLARRRKNYQLRRQRAANAQLGFDQTYTSNVTRVESETLNNNLAIVSVSDVNVQSDCAMQDGYIEEYEKEEAPTVKCDGETTFHEPYRYPRLPRLNQIRKLARGLNGSIDKSSVEGAQGIGAGADEESAELVDPHYVLRRRVRLIHVKHLARALNSNAGKTCEQNHLCRMQVYDSEQENIIPRTNDQMASEGANSNGAVK